MAVTNDSAVMGSVGVSETVGVTRATVDAMTYAAVAKGLDARWNFACLSQDVLCQRSNRIIASSNDQDIYR